MLTETELHEVILDSLLDSGGYIDLPDFGGAISAFFAKDGGLDAFLDHYREQLAVAREKHPGSKFVLDAHRDLLKLMAQAQSMEDVPTAIEDMDADQTREYLATIVMEQLARKRAQQQLLTADAAPEKPQPHDLAIDVR